MRGPLLANLSAPIGSLSLAMVGTMISLSGNEGLAMLSFGALIQSFPPGKSRSLKLTHNS